MKPEKIAKALRVAVDIKEVDARRTPGRWRWWTSNSFRRLSSDATGKDGDVAHGCVQSDGHPDIVIREEDMKYSEQACNAAPVLAEALLAVASERDFLKRREEDIIAATEPADGGQYRADIASAILRQRRKLDEAKAALEAWAPLRAAMDAIVKDYGGKPNQSDLSMDMIDAAERAYLDDDSDELLRVAALAMLLRGLSKKG